MPYVQRAPCSQCGSKVRIFYDEFGAGNNGDPPTMYKSVRDTLSFLPKKQVCPTILLTHGFGSGSDIWKAQIPALVGAGHHVIVWDMRGHAKSSAPEHSCCYNKQHQVDDMVAVIDAAGRKDSHGNPEPVILCGHSMGGYDNLLFYFAHPAKIAALVLYGTGPGFASDKSRLKWNKTAAKMAAGYRTKGLAALRGSDKTKGHRSAVGLALSCEYVFGQHDTDPLYQSFKPHGTLTAARSLDQVDVPVSLLVGEFDKGFLGASKFMKKKIRGSVLRELTGVGHMACEKDPAQFNKVCTR